MPRIQCDEFRAREKRLDQLRIFIPDVRGPLAHDEEGRIMVHPMGLVCGSKVRDVREGPFDRLEGQAEGIRFRRGRSLAVRHEELPDAFVLSR
jgi:hypothetical protein